MAYERIIVAGNMIEAERIVTLKGGEYFRFTPDDKRERVIHVDNPGLILVKEIPPRLHIETISETAHAFGNALGDFKFRRIG